jgi:hypothetical protein
MTPEEDEIKTQYPGVIAETYINVMDANGG